MASEAPKENTKYCNTLHVMGIIYRGSQLFLEGGKKKDKTRY